jgi:hypothetical protein
MKTGNSFLSDKVGAMSSTSPGTDADDWCHRWRGQRPLGHSSKVLLADRSEELLIYTLSFSLSSFITCKRKHTDIVITYSSVSPTSLGVTWPSPGDLDQVHIRTQEV